MSERILSAGVVVVSRVDESWRVLLLRAYNYWDCPKGVVEAGEDPLVAARREVREETSLGELDFHWGDEFIETAPYSNNKVARYYLAGVERPEVKLPVNPTLGHPEHHEFRWAGFAEAARLVVPRVADVLDWARARVES
ncbi:MAG TPA: NUDIX domain-containing protein [Steroidobacteraceae bacterium]|jgi:bis(5'-nucleosidyl)-tetraphosphatase|nr:NUDIX domain-containing protein [Steroidobacteraceae bacterium]